jgi:hypothetical protein
MEPTTSLVTALAAKSGGAAVDVAKEEAKGFLQKLLGPSAEAIGEDWALRHRERLFNNVVEVLARAKNKLKVNGLSPREVSPKIIHPLLEAASFEEDEDIREMWVNLLAGEASPQRSPFAASFVNILRQLSVEEARFLKALFAKVGSEMERYNDLPPDGRPPHPMTRIGSFEELQPMVLETAGVNGTTPEEKNYFSMLASSALDNLSRLGILVSPSVGRPSYRLTTLGLMLLGTCCEPRPALRQ